MAEVNTNKQLPVYDSSIRTIKLFGEKRYQRYELLNMN